MTKQLKSGDRVSWKSHGGTAHGKVVKKLTSSTEIKGRVGPGGVDGLIVTFERSV